MEKNISIIGATGYTGYELVKILAKLNGPKIKHLTSETLAGRLYSDVYPALRGVVDIPITKSDPDKISAESGVVFLCMPHGEAMEVAGEFLKRGVKVIDLSADFRLNSETLFEEAYKKKHTAPELLKEAVYGLAEVYAEEIKKTRLAACPGCYPTSGLIPLLPLLKAGAIDPLHIVIDSKSGVSGAGKKPTESSHFCEVNESVKPYGIFSHRHGYEIDHIIERYTGLKVKTLFTPHLIPVTRGMLSTIYIKSEESEETLTGLWREFYKGKSYVRILPKGQVPAMAYTTNSWYIDIALFKRGEDVIIVSALDNLMKGASSQAVQCYELMSGSSYGVL